MQCNHRHNQWDELQNYSLVLGKFLQFSKVHGRHLKLVLDHFVICYLALVIQRLFEYYLHQKGKNYSTEKIQGAIRSATITKLNVDEREIFIKNKADDVFSDILSPLDLKDIPAYSQKDKRTNAYLQKNKKLLKNEASEKVRNNLAKHRI